MQPGIATLGDQAGDELVKVVQSRPARWPPGRRTRQRADGVIAIGLLADPLCELSRLHRLPLYIHTCTDLA
jgi:hypothetical protein